jgi:predicted  nucleic acid-binding Zn-ribbon protein
VTRWRDSQLERKREARDMKYWPDYRCPKCGRTYKRNSTKRWMPSFCERTGKNTRLYRVPSTNSKGRKPCERDAVEREARDHDAKPAEGRRTPNRRRSEMTANNESREAADARQVNRPWRKKPMPDPREKHKPRPPL